MRIENYLDFSGKRGFSGLFFVSGSFGTVDGDAVYEKVSEAGKERYVFQNESVRLCAEFEQVDGICVRRDTLTNRSGQVLEIHDLVSRFCLDGNDYDVYTQYSGWQHESEGEWQHLRTQIRAESCGMRGCEGATPMMGFHNRYTGRNTVFHLLPNAQWQMTAKKFPHSAKEIVVLEAGFCSVGLRLSVAAGETVRLPELIFFGAQSKTDLDAYKLHQYFNKVYPRRSLPAFFNSWMYCFDELNIDALKRQADAAADMGLEAFMIDAGWFGVGENWSASVGDWEENTVSGPRGRLSELADYVRSRGMIFGLWFEPERANAASRAVAEHPEYYIPAGKYFLLDFANPQAVSYMLEILTARIVQYGIGWVKFDFNASLPTDPSGDGFYRYLAGQRRLFEELRRRFPSLYITNCASGGYRMDLYQAQFSDSFWLSDNQGPLGGIDIVKGTLKRMPSACIERWNVQKYADGFPRYGEKETVGVMFNCNNGTWDSIVAVDPSLAESFLLGGPMGFSCDLTSFSEKYRLRWREVIAQYKRERDFWMRATARVLADTESITVLQYADAALDTCVIQIFTKNVHARDLMIYPTVDGEATYCYRDGAESGKELAENGICVTDLRENSCQTLVLTKQNA